MYPLEPSQSWLVAKRLIFVPQISIDLLSIVIISLPFMITLLESMNGDYRVFNSSIMGTNYNSLKDSYNSLLSYVIYVFQTNWKLYLITGLLCFSIPLIVAYLLNENKHRKLIFLIIYGCSALLCCILLKSLYVLFAFSISLSIMFFITNENNEKVNKDITKTFKILILSSLILLFVLPIWIIMPSLFKNTYKSPHTPYKLNIFKQGRHDNPYR